MTTGETESRSFVNLCCSVPYEVFGLGRNLTRTKSWPNNGPILPPMDRPGSQPPRDLSLTLRAEVSDNRACVSYVSDNAGGPS
jgi:hypothetical protein